MTVFDLLVKRIEAAYEDLGHDLGWRFLSTPKRTLSSGSRLAFVGVNPGGRVWKPPMPSVEEGNAYRVERWGKGETMKPLQIQVCRLYESLAGALNNGSSPEQLMDDTLASNFCPFRSPAWGKLPNRKRSIAFSMDLWRSMLEVVAPRAVICLGAPPAGHLQATLISQGAHRIGAPIERLVNWGDMTYALTHYQTPQGRRTLIVRIPHLSRFAIFGRAASKPAVEELVSTIAAAITA